MTSVGLRIIGLIKYSQKSGLWGQSLKSDLIQIWIEMTWNWIEKWMGIEPNGLGMDWQWFWDALGALKSWNITFWVTLKPKFDTKIDQKCEKRTKTGRFSGLLRPKIGLDMDQEGQSTFHRGSNLCLRPKNGRKGIFGQDLTWKFD